LLLPHWQARRCQQLRGSPRRPPERARQLQKQQRRRHCGEEEQAQAIEKGKKSENIARLRITNFELALCPPIAPRLQGKKTQNKKKPCRPLPRKSPACSRRKTATSTSTRAKPPLTTRSILCAKRPPRWRGESREREREREIVSSFLRGFRL